MVEIPPHDELPDGLPAFTGPADGLQAGGDHRDPSGRFKPGNAIASKGGQARAGKVRLATRLGLSAPGDDAAMAPYLRSAASFRKAYLADMAKTVGGGAVGPGPASLVATASVQLAWSRYLSDQAAITGDPDLAHKSSRFGDASRQNLLAAHSLCASEARTRPTPSYRDPLGPIPEHLMLAAKVVDK